MTMLPSHVSATDHPGTIVTLTRGGYVFVFPVAPEEIKVEGGRTVETTEILNRSQVTRVGNRRVKRLSFSGFLPRDFDPNMATYTPYKNTPTRGITILDGWVEERPSRSKTVFASVKGFPFARHCYIEDFDYWEQAGAPGDIYYSITLVEFVAASIAQLGRINFPPGPGSPAPTGGGKRYTIISGDTLWAIAKRNYGSGSLWPIIWAANRPMRSGNPDLIYPGEVITIPPR